MVAGRASPTCASWWGKSPRAYGLPAQVKQIAADRLWRDDQQYRSPERIFADRYAIVILG
jgi:hypothetical protein